MFISSVKHGKADTFLSTNEKHGHSRCFPRSVLIVASLTCPHSWGAKGDCVWCLASVCPLKRAAHGLLGHRISCPYRLQCIQSSENLTQQLPLNHWICRLLQTFHLWSSVKDRHLFISIRFINTDWNDSSNIFPVMVWKVPWGHWSTLTTALVIEYTTSNNCSSYNCHLPFKHVMQYSTVLHGQLWV